MNILSINRHHNASACLLVDGEIVLHIEEERLSRIKTDCIPYFSLIKALSLGYKIDHLIINGFSHNTPGVEIGSFDFYSTVLLKNFNLQKVEPYEIKIHHWIHNHHETHAACAFYNSGFDKSICIVTDGGGSYDPKTQLQEAVSIYYAEYPATFQLLYRKFNKKDEFVSTGNMFEAISQYLGFGIFDAGKVMGLSSYGKYDPKMPNLESPRFFDQINGTMIFNFQGIDKDNFDESADLAYHLQKITEKRGIELFEKIPPDCENICLTGGVALNCVANYELLNHLKNRKLYVEPISNDSGTAIGAAKLLHHSLTKDRTIREQKNIFYGPTYQNIDFPKNNRNTNMDEIANLISDGKIIACFQGRSESGPRALGNRSILFDPRIENGKDIINKIKKREHFRPFAGIILEEHADQWFDMRGKKSSEFMMYAVRVLKNKENLIPSIVHVDGTCRVQTVSKDNLKLYALVESFFHLVGVPILLNTSFNLAGEPLVETPEDAFRTYYSSEIDYLYFPEYKKLIYK
jgi:carbamoyltransferase